MSWFRRGAAVAAPAMERESLPVGAVRRTPGLSIFFEGVGAGVRTFLDLGPAADGNLRCYQPFAGRVRFADIETLWRGEGSLADALRALRRDQEAPCDMVLAWNVLDPLESAQRIAVMATLADLTVPGARLHFMADMAETPSVRRLRFTVVDRDHVHWRETGVPQPPLDRLVPADVERLIQPFQLQHAFVLRDGMREFVAVRA